MSTKTVEVANWQFSDIPFRLGEFLSKLNDVVRTIPPEYRENAEIDCDPKWEFGESYAQIRISYSRQMTKAEISEDDRQARAHWEDQLQAAVERQAYCEKQLAGLERAQ